MKKFLIGLISIALFVALPVSGIAHELGATVNVATAMGALVASLTVYYSSNIPQFYNPLTTMRNGIEVEMWSDFIANNLFRGIEWLTNCVRADQYVLKGKVVHIPQAGTKPNAQKNRAFSPTGTNKTRRTDVDVMYPLDEYTTDPVVIEDASNVQLSYDKMESVLGDHVGVLNELILDNILNVWMPTLAANMIRTTGAAVPAHLPISTGTRKAFTLNDMKLARVTLNKQKVLRKDRFAVMSEDMWSQLEGQLQAMPAKDYSVVMDPIEGEIRRLYGFTIITTPVMPVYDNAATPVVRAVGAAGTIADNDAVLFYQKNHLELALGEIKFFETPNSAIDYGDVYSALVRMGGRKRYANETGVVVLIQAV
jgi:Phage capsid protein